MTHRELLRHYTVIRVAAIPLPRRSQRLPLSLCVLHPTTMPSSIVTHAYRLKRRKKALAAVVAAPTVITATKPGVRKSKSEGVLRSDPISPQPAVFW
jgi:hypothetical protein